MNKKLLLLLLSFLILGFVSSFAQEDEEAESQALLNPNYSQWGQQSVFDGQPIMGSPWEWLHQQPNGNTLRWVKMWDADNWYACGYAGTFMKTTDAGATWMVQKTINGVDNNGSSEIAYDAWFFDMNTGIVVGGYGTCYKTTDGGVTWDSLASFPTAATAYDIYFVDDTLGFACGTTSMLVQRTTDGGATWTALSPPSATYYRVLAIDENNIIASSSSGNVRGTTDGGITWTTINVGQSSTLYDMEFTDPLNGWVCGSGDNPAYTTDGGLTWTLSAAVPTASTQYDIDVMSTSMQTLYEGFEDVTFPPTGWTETGTTTIWDRSTSASGYGTGLASARAYFYGVSSGTGILTTVAFAPTSATDSLKFDHAYATYISDDDQLEIFTSTDGGSTWTSLILLHGGVSGELVTAPPTTSSFVPTAGEWATKTFALPVGTNMVRFDGITAYGNNLYLDNIQVGAPSVASQVYVTGDAFNIFSTTDMGTTWNPVDFLDPAQSWTGTYYSTDWMAPDNFVTVGATGLINEVNSSEAIVSHTLWIKAGTLYALWAASEGGTVIAAGAAGNTTSFDQSMYSTDGGETWAVSTMMDSADLDFNDISMVDSVTGYSAGEDYRVMKTTDGGASWFRVTDPVTSTSDAECLFFVDENTGYVFGVLDDGYKTTDGGTTWSVLTTGVTPTFNKCYFTDANTGWVVGATGTVIHTTDGGATFTPQDPLFTSTIYSIWMVNANVGYLSGSTGTVRKTTDGGTTWVNINPSSVTSPPALYDIEFLNEDNGMVVGSTGRTYFTQDGGTTWYFENSGMSTIYEVAIETASADTSSTYVCGTGAYVLRNSLVITPVELASFTASVSGSNVSLEWETATELNNIGFEIERKETDAWQKLGFIEGNGTSTEIHSYKFVDRNLSPGVYSYRIKQMDFDGTYEYYELSQTVEIGVPVDFSMSQNYPNPFNPTTKITYSVPVDGFVSISIFNILGEKVTTLVSANVKAGNYELTFDATNMASGMYLYRMESGDYISVKKMMILK